MPKVDWKEIDCLNARCIGYEDYPAKNKCPYDFGKQPHAHTAYWDGWSEAAAAHDSANGSAQSDENLFSEDVDQED